MWEGVSSLLRFSAKSHKNPQVQQAASISIPGTIKTVNFWDLGASCRFAAGPGYPL
jgi:hypothetical protein